MTYLESGNYFGIDPNKWLIDEAIEKELTADFVAKKRCKFDYNDRFDCSVFGERFDFIFAQSIFSHSGKDRIAQALSSFRNNIKPEGVIAATFVVSNDKSTEYKGNGWVYPECVSYTRGSIVDLAHQAGLIVIEIPWYHPRQTWFLFATQWGVLPDEHFVRSHLSGLSYRNQPEI